MRKQGKARGFSVRTLVFHIFMKFSDAVSKMLSSSDHATHPTGYGWSCSTWSG